MAPETTTSSRLTAVEAKVRELEQGLGQPPEGMEPIGLFEMFHILKGMMEDMKGMVDARLEIVERKVESVVQDLDIMKMAIREQAQDRSSSTKVRVPEPSHFGGVRNAKELENFLWDMESYFQAAKIPENEKVSITSMYLTGDAKLWWRTRSTDEARRPIESWEVLKKEMKEQFLPTNTSWLARDALKRLRHTGSVHEYVNEFSSLMLDIRGMSEEDKLYNFMSGLQSWAQAELRRQGVKDLQAAFAAADRLVDYSVMEDPNHTDLGQRDVGQGKVGKKKPRKQIETTREMASSSKTSTTGKAKGCYICGDEGHLMRFCPKRAKVNAIMAELNKGENEEEDELCRMGTLKVLDDPDPKAKEGSSAGLGPKPSRYY